MTSECRLRQELVAVLSRALAHLLLRLLVQALSEVAGTLESRGVLETAVHLVANSVPREPSALST